MYLLLKLLNTNSQFYVKSQDLHNFMPIKQYSCALGQYLLLYGNTYITTHYYLWKTSLILLINPELL